MSCKKSFAAILGAVCLLACVTGPALAAVEVRDAWYAYGEKSVLWAETELGDLTADTVRTAAGADAVILTAACFRKDLNAGSYDRERLAEVFSPEETLVAVRVNTAQMKALLEAGAASYVVDENEYIDYEASASPLFPQVSGVRFTCDVSAPAGQRITRIEPEAEALTLITTPTLLEACPEAEALEAQPLGISLPEVFYGAYDGADSFPEPETGRMTVIGSNSSLIARRFPRVVLLGVPFLLILLLLYGKRRLIREEATITDKEEP